MGGKHGDVVRKHDAGWQEGVPVSEQATVRLRPPANQLDGRAIGWWRVQLLALSAVPVVVLVVLGIVLPKATLWLLLPAVLLAVLGAVAVVLLPRWWYRLHRWEVTDSAVYARSGYFTQQWRIAPMSRIQTVDTQRGPLEQVFGLATVTVTTASAKGAIAVEGLDAELAADLAQRLTRVTQATPGDAT